MTAHVSVAKSAETPRLILAPEDEGRVVPFWLVRQQSRAAGSGNAAGSGDAAGNAAANLDTFLVEAAAPSSLTIKDPASNDASKMASINMRIPVLSNPDAIKAGSRLVVKAEGARKRKAPTE